MYCLSECFPTCNIPMWLKHKVLVDPSHLYVWIKAAAWQSTRVTEKLLVWQGNRDTHKAVERNESEKEYKTLSYFFNFQRNGTDIVFITAVISTSGPCISQFTLFSPVKYHRPITDDCSVAAYVTHHPCSFWEILARQTDEKKEAERIIVENGSCFTTNDLTFYPPQLLVSDNLWRQLNIWSTTNNVWKREYVKTRTFLPEGHCFGFLFTHFPSSRTVGAVCSDLHTISLFSLPHGFRKGFLGIY